MINPAETAAFRTLGISPKATPQEIKRAFRRLAKKYHPDKNRHNPKLIERFKDISWAYKAALEIQASRARRSMAGGGVFGLGGLFRPSADKCFYPNPSNGKELAASVNISFGESVRGASVSVTLEAMTPCAQCGGLGSERPDNFFCCPKCQGAGRVLEGDGGFLGPVVCHRCLGNGRVLKKCGACGGEGRLYGTKTLNFSLPAGVEDSSVIVIKGEGNAGAMGGQPGDLCVTAKVEPSETFLRRGMDIHVEAKAPFTMAAFGGTVVVPTLKGEARVTIPPGLRSHTLLRLKGRGINGEGSQFIRLIWEVPAELSPKEKKLLADFARLYGYPAPEPDEAGALEWLKRLFCRGQAL